MAIGANIFAGADASVSAAPTSPDTVTAMYGPASGGGRHALHPGTHFGLGFWGAVGGAVALVMIRWSLPR